ncbi:MAG: hypothetical protein AAF604_09415 [Acidobacteriota bacterium]
MKIRKTWGRPIIIVGCLVLVALAVVPTTLSVPMHDTVQDWLVTPESQLRSDLGLEDCPALTVCMELCIISDSGSVRGLGIFDCRTK